MDQKLRHINHHTIRRISKDILECSICRELMHPPIRECILGHNFCDNCFDEISICAICRQPKALGRNFALEKVSLAMTVNCDNRHRGCKFRGIFTIVEDHEVACPAARISCPIVGCECKILLLNVIKHCEQFHPKKLVVSNKMNLVHLNFFNPYGIRCLRDIPFLLGTQTLLRYKYWVFRPFCRVDPQNISWHISYIGPQCFPERCWFNLKLIVPGKKTIPLIMHQKCKPFPIDDIRIFEFEHQIRHSSLRSFCRNGDLHYSLEIYEKSYYH